MSKWLEAAKASRSPDKTDKTDKTPARAREKEVLPVLSVLSRVPDTNFQTDHHAGQPLARSGTTSISPREGLPTEPPTCAACGVADWHVSITEADKRKLHVGCCAQDQKAELRRFKAPAEELIDDDGVLHACKAIEDAWPS